MSNYPKTLEEAQQNNYKFWSSQPMIKLNEHVNTEGRISDNKENNQAVTIPNGYYWKDMDIWNREDCTKIYNFLDLFYTQDLNNKFKLHYKKEFLQWVLGSSNSNISLALIFNNEIVGFISGVVGKYQVKSEKLDMIDINFLCIHPQLRGRNIAPLLIQEIRNRFKSNGFNYAFFTTDRYIPQPFSTVKYYHRALNPKKLIDIGFIKPDDNTNDEEIINTYKLPSKTSNESGQFKKMEEKHLNDAFYLLNEYFKKYSFHPIFTFDEFKRRFYNNPIVSSYVVEEYDDHGSYVVDFISYYKTSMKVSGEKNKKNKFVDIGYLYYYTSLDETSYRLIRDIMIMAYNEKIDVLNAFDVMENSTILSELNFLPGTGTLHYYFYDWKIRPLLNNQIAAIVF